VCDTARRRTRVQFLFSIQSGAFRRWRDGSECKAPRTALGLTIPQSACQHSRHPKATSQARPRSLGTWDGERGGDGIHVFCPAPFSDKHVLPACRGMQRKVKGHALCLNDGMESGAGMTKLRRSSYAARCSIRSRSRSWNAAAAALPTTETDRFAPLWRGGTKSRRRLAAGIRRGGQALPGQVLHARGTSPGFRCQCACCRAGKEGRPVHGQCSDAKPATRSCGVPRGREAVRRGPTRATTALRRGSLRETGIILPGRSRMRLRRSPELRQGPLGPHRPHCSYGKVGRF